MQTGRDTVSNNEYLLAFMPEQKEGTSQRTHRHEAEAQTAVWDDGRTGSGRKRATGANGDVCNSVSHKNEVKKKITL